MNIKNLSISNIFSDKVLCTLFTIVMCIQFIWIEGYGISPVKVGLMALSPLILLGKRIEINKGMIGGLLLLISCFLCAYFAGPVRTSTFGYFAMFVITFIVYYSLLRRGAFTLEYFQKLCGYLIIAFGLVLICQQIATLIGISNFPIINLSRQPFLAIDKLPSLAIEPSHSARLLTVFMLGYLRCIQISNNDKPTLRLLFNSNHRAVTILFLWSMLTMGSGTAVVGLGLLAIFFINYRSAIYVIPCLLALISLGSYLEITQMERAAKVAAASTSLDNKKIDEADGSASVRISPLVNFLTKTDLSKTETWIGQGNQLDEDTNAWWRDKKDTLPMIKYYGLISWIICIIFIYACMIRRIFSIETLVFIVLFGLTLMNSAYAWGAMFIFAAVRYFQEQEESGTLELAEEELDEDLENRLIAGKESAD